jgi:hypothetical protein
LNNINFPKKIDLYYDLDSKADKAKLIGDEEKLQNYLENIVKSKDKELFLIVSNSIERHECWKE